MHRLDFARNAGLSSIDSETLRSALRQFASGVTIVTASFDGTMAGITVSAFSSISLEPPIVMVSINNESSLLANLVQAEHFGVNVLHETQEPLARRFAESIPPAEKFLDVPLAIGRSGAPRIIGAIAWLDCVLDQTLRVATHTLMFGRVVEAHAPDLPGDPLVYYCAEYRRLA